MQSRKVMSSKWTLILATVLVAVLTAAAPAAAQPGTLKFDEASFEVLEEAGVAITPGHDFGDYRASQHVRFAYTTGLDRLHEGVRRIEGFIGSRL